MDFSGPGGAASWEDRRLPFLSEAGRAERVRPADCAAGEIGKTCSPLRTGGVAGGAGSGRR
jgi:hypothetical protein